MSRKILKIGKRGGYGILLVLAVAGLAGAGLYTYLANVTQDVTISERVEWANTELWGDTGGLDWGSAANKVGAPFDKIIAPATKPSGSTWTQKMWVHDNGQGFLIDADDLEFTGDSVITYQFRANTPGTPGTPGEVLDSLVVPAGGDGLKFFIEFHIDAWSDNGTIPLSLKFNVPN